MSVRDVKMTSHAEKRAAERSVPEIGRWLLMDFGVRRRAGNGTESVYFDNKSWKEVERFCGVWPLKKMDQLRRLYAVVSDSGAVVTFAYRNQ